MDICREDVKSLLQTFLVVSPFLWGVWEFRKFREQLNDIYKTTLDLNNKLDEISKNKLDNYPLLKDIKQLLDNVNKVFKPK